MSYLFQLLILSLLIIFLFFKIFIVKNISLLLVILILLLLFIGISFINKKHFPVSRKKRDAVFIISVCSILLIGSMYLIGCKIGFSVNYSYIFKNYLEKSVFLEIVTIIILSEVLRKKLLSFNSDNKIKNGILNILIIFFFVLIDCSISDMSRNFKTFTEFYDYFGLIIVSSFVKNIFLNYTIRKYGLSVNFTYRLLMDIRVFFLPVVPKINVFIESCIYLIYPYILYIVLDNFLSDRELENARRKKRSFLLDIPFYILSIIFIMLISREFTYSMIAIGSGSMTGEFSKGDAVIYKRYDVKQSTIESQKLKKGDIIVFKIRNKIIVHRINDIYSLYGKDVYVTKGDANDLVDNWVVRQSDVVGVVKCKIKFIAWPSVWLTENFK